MATAWNRHLLGAVREGRLQSKNRKDGESNCRRIVVNEELPMKERYATFVEALVGAPGKDE